LSTAIILRCEKQNGYSQAKAFYAIFALLASETEKQTKKKAGSKVSIGQTEDKHNPLRQKLFRWFVANDLSFCGQRATTQRRLD
jgi:hypothetical protein